MVDALNRLDQTDALVEQILGDRAKLERHANRGHAQSNSHAQAYPMEAETTSSTESNHYHNHKAASDTESDQLDWDPDNLMMTAIPWWTKTGPLWYTHTAGRTSGRGCSEFADGLGARIPGISKKLARFSHKTWSQQTRDKPVQESRAKNYVREETTETRPKHPHTIPRQSERSQHRTCHWSRAEKTHPLLPLLTTWTYGEKVSESSTEGHSPICSQELLFARRCLCTIA